MPDDGTIIATPAATAGTPAPAPAGESTPPPAAAAPFDWSKAGLDQAHLNLVTERGWKSPGDVMTSYRHLETATGVPPERLIKLPAPKDAANPEVWNDIYKRLGRPETADKYIIPVPEGDKGEFAAEVKPVLHKIGLTGDQATKLGEWWNGRIASTQKAQAAEAEAANAKEMADLKMQWGTDFDKNDEIAFRAIEQFGMKTEHYAALKASMGYKNAMQWLYNIGSKIAVEDRTVPGMSGQNANMGGMTREAAAAKIVSLKQDRDYVKQFNSPDPKQRREARDEMSRLSRLAAPEISPVSGSYGQRK